MFLTPKEDFFIEGENRSERFSSSTKMILGSKIPFVLRKLRFPWSFVINKMFRQNFILVLLWIFIFCTKMWNFRLFTKWLVYAGQRNIYCNSNHEDKSGSNTLRISIKAAAHFSVIFLAQKTSCVTHCYSREEKCCVTTYDRCM